MKISFIIPVYKVEQYLKQCVDSVLSQTYQDIEVILVDDGSPDNCPSICDEYAKKGNRVTVIHKTNGGLSSARNEGMKKATGDYVCFVDSDDFFEGKDSLGKMTEVLLAAPSIDVLFFNVFYYDNQTGAKTNWPVFQKTAPDVCTTTEAIELLVKSGTVPMAAWGKVVRRSLLNDSGLSFIGGLYGEDNPWFIALMEQAKDVAFMNEYVYAYRQNVSTSITKSNRAKHIKDMKFIIENECKHLSGSKAEKQWIDCMYSFVAYNYCILLSQYEYAVGEEKESYWKFMRQYEYLLNYTNHIKVKKVNRVYRLVGLKPTAWVLRYYMKYR